MILNASASVPTSLLGIIGINKIDLNLTSTSKWGETRLRVALVLDNTGSMAQNGKMTALIAATKSLLGQLQNAATVNGDVYVSIVPFVKDVNLDPTNWSSDYIYWGTTTGASPQDPNATDDSSWDANNGTCSAGNYSPRSTCFAARDLLDFGQIAEPMCQRGHLLEFHLHHAEHVHGRGHLLDIRAKRRRAPAPARALARYPAKPRRTDAPARALARYLAKLAEHMHQRGHLLDIEQNHAEQLH